MGEAYLITNEPPRLSLDKGISTRWPTPLGTSWVNGTNSQGVDAPKNIQNDWNLLSNHRMEPIFSTYTRSLFRGMYRFYDRANSPSPSWSPSSSRSHSLILNFFFSFFFLAPRPTATTVPLLSLNLTYDPDPTTRSNTSNQTREKQENHDQGHNSNTFRNPM